MPLAESSRMIEGLDQIVFSKRFKTHQQRRAFEKKAIKKGWSIDPDAGHTILKPDKTSLTRKYCTIVMLEIEKSDNSR